MKKQEVTVCDEQIYLETIMPKKYRLRKLNQVLDLSFLPTLVQNCYSTKKRRPPIEPEMFFRILIIGYLDGIQCDRKLIEEIHVNLAYRWFIGLRLNDKIPSHSSITRTRDRFGEATFQAVFLHLIDRCRENGLLKGQGVICDATIFAANAATEKVIKIDGESLTDAKNISIKTHVCTTDPDATIVGRPGYRQQVSYKAHYSIDSSSRIITDFLVTTGAKYECTIFADQIRHLKHDLNLPVTEVTADSGYGFGPIYQFLKGEGITAFIPLRDKSVGKGRRCSSEGCTYLPDEDIYRCPQGHTLQPQKPLNGVTRYRTEGGICQICPVRDNCIPVDRVRKQEWINRNVFANEYEEIRAAMESNKFHDKMAERQLKIEGLFAEAKQNHCLHRAKYRGKSKVQIQVYMIAMVQNLKRVMQYAA